MVARSGMTSHFKEEKLAVLVEVILMILLWFELCLPKIPTLKPYFYYPQNVTLAGSKVTADIITKMRS